VQLLKETEVLLTVLRVQEAGV